MVTFSGESYYAVLKGMVRQEDIGADLEEGLRYRNIVSSQYIADAQIEFVSKGSLNDAQKESWYQKIASVVIHFSNNELTLSYKILLDAFFSWHFSVFGARIKDSNRCSGKPK